MVVEGHPEPRVELLCNTRSNGFCTTYAECGFENLIQGLGSVRKLIAWYGILGFQDFVQGIKNSVAENFRYSIVNSRTEIIIEFRYASTQVISLTRCRENYSKYNYSQQLLSSKI